MIMKNGHGGSRPGAGRKKKTLEQKLVGAVPAGLEKAVAQILENDTSIEFTEIKKLAHRVAYMEQELEFLKKILLAENKGKSKC